MSELDAAGLMSDWGEVFSTAAPSSADGPGCHCGALRRPWQGRAAEPAANDAGLDPDAPDFGIRFARRFVAGLPAGTRCAPAQARPAQTATAAWHLEMDPARHPLLRAGRGGSGRWRGRPVAAPACGGAGDRHPPRSESARPAAPVAGLPRRGGRESGDGAGLDAAAVEAYQALFFDVRDRQQHPWRFVAALGDAPAVSGRETAAGISRPSGNSSRCPCRRHCSAAAWPTAKGPPESSMRPRMPGRLGVSDPRRAAC